MVAPTHSLHKISVHWGAKFYSESGLVDKRPFFLRYSRIFWNGKSATKSSKITHCTIQPAKPNQKFISKKSTNIVFENSAQSTWFLYNEAVGMLKPSVKSRARSCPEKIVTNRKSFAVIPQDFYCDPCPRFFVLLYFSFLRIIKLFSWYQFSDTFPKELEIKSF